MDKTAVLKTLNSIMEFELAGVVRYTHYVLKVYEELLALVKDQIVCEVDKMLRQPGQTDTFSAP